MRAVLLDAPPITDEALAGIPDVAGVFLLRAGEDSKYLARTAFLRRRILRTIRMFRLQPVLRSVEVWPAGSRFESALVHYQLARELFPDTYPRLVRLARPAYVKVTVANAFPRLQATTRIGPRGVHVGPFRTRAEAEAFETGMLEFFQMRRCQEDLEPRADHPGCIYGEMNMCLRPCQAVVSIDEYGAEVNRAVEFLRSRGRSLLHSTAAARDRLSEEMNFEAAAREHRLFERISAVVSLGGDLAGDLERLYGVAVLPALEAGSVRLQFLWKGAWLPAHVFAPDGLSGSLDHALRELVEALRPEPVTLLERQEHLALLSRWFYSSRREGEWIGFEDPAKAPWRRLVKAISRVALH